MREEEMVIISVKRWKESARENQTWETCELDVISFGFLNKEKKKEESEAIQIVYEKRKSPESWMASCIAPIYKEKEI